MKVTNSIVLSLLVFLFFNCSDNELESKEYVFVEKYCATIVVGGVVGLQEKCYEIHDVVLAETRSDTFITIRISNGPQISDTPGPWSFQELLDVPLIYLKEK